MKTKDPITPATLRYNTRLNTNVRKLSRPVLCGIVLLKDEHGVAESDNVIRILT